MLHPALIGVLNAVLIYVLPDAKSMAALCTAEPGAENADVVNAYLLLDLVKVLG